MLSSGGVNLHVARKASTKALILDECGSFAKQKGQCSWDHRERGIRTDFKVRDHLVMIRCGTFRTSQSFEFYSRCI